MKLILASAEDPAAQNIVARLLKLYDFRPVPARPSLHVFGNVALTTVACGALQIHDLPLAADEVIVASRHASESGMPTLTVHAPGEPSKRELAIASPPTIKAAIRALINARDELNLFYEVSLEATHHGPTGLTAPVTFVEIGSSPTQWRDQKAAEAVARAIVEAATSPVRGPQAIGFGGPHYAPRHTQVILQTDTCIGHIFPKYVALDEELIRHAIERTSGGVELFAIDWKGLGNDQRKFLQQIAAKFGLRAAREGELLAEQKFKLTSIEMTTADTGQKGD